MERGFEIPSFSYETSFFEVPGRPGAVRQQRKLRHIEFELPLIYRNQRDKKTDKEIIDEVVIFLDYDEPVKIQFTNQDWYWLADIDGPFNVATNTRGFVRFVLIIKLADPYKYGSKLIASIDPIEPAVLVNEGTAPAKPIFRFNVTQPTTFIDIIKDDDYMSIGQPESVDALPFNPRTRRFNDEMRTTVGWGEAFFQPDGGAKAGKMVVLDGEEFGATDYGTGTAWHGPILQKSFEPCDDYYVRTRFNVRTNNSKQRARGDMYFLTTDGSQIGKMSAVIRDSSMRATIEVRLQNGLNVIYPINRTNAFEKGFFGFVAITKKGTKFQFDIGVEKSRTDGGSGFEVVHKETHYFDDINGGYQLPLSAIAAHVSTWGSNPLPWRARLRSVVVEKVNQETGIPYIVQPGDEVVIDHEKELILINDEPRTDLKDFGGNYFCLPPGDSVIMLNPPDAFSATAEWRSVYK